jgi:hypothetical protein
MGDDLARRIEAKLGKPHGWMDALHLHDAGPRMFLSYNYDSHLEAAAAVLHALRSIALDSEGSWREGDIIHLHGTLAYPARDPDDYALRVKGDALRPRVKPGEFIIVQPSRSIHPGDEVVVNRQDGVSMLKVLGAQRGGLIELFPVNEGKPISIDEQEIAGMHYVGGIVKDDLYRSAT